MKIVKNGLKVVEIFSSIQGESKYTGFPTTFIRLSGCPLKCSYCDTPHSEFRAMTVASVMQTVTRMKNMHICITGGEPLLYEDTYTLIYELKQRGYIVSVETSGAVMLEDYSYERGFTFVVDLKVPSSKMHTKMIPENFTKLKAHDEVKIVLENAGDYEWASEFLSQHKTNASIILSPVFKKRFIDTTWLVNKMFEQPIRNKQGLPARLGMQMHRIIGVQ